MLDTNVIIRLVTRDHLEHLERARVIFEEIENEERIAHVTEGVIVECVQVLSSRSLYALARADIQFYLDALLDLPYLRIAHKPAYRHALDLYAATSLDFVDCLNVAHMERSGIREIISFDRHYDRLSTIQRVEE